MHDIYLQYHIRMHLQTRMHNDSMLLAVPGSTKLFIKKPSGERFAVYVYATHTTDTVKEKIQDKEGIPPNRQRLTFAGVQLESGVLLFDYNIQSKDTIDLEVLDAEQLGAVPNLRTYEELHLLGLIDM